ncbi:MAG: serine O-acetyltransferase EpsC [Verrucomicrobiota bacterium]
MTKTADQIADRLLDSYRQVGGINNIDGINLPSKCAVHDICCKMLHLLFPGFYTVEGLHTHSVASDIAKQIEEINRSLAGEIYKSLEFAPPEKISSKTDDLNGLSHEITCDFLERLSSLRQILSTDVDAAFAGDPAAKSLEEIILAYPAIEAISIQRAAHILHKSGVALIPRMMTEWAHSRTGIDIHPGAEIDSHFFIDHGTGVVIGETCKIGAHVKIYHGVTLGARSTSGGQQLRGVKRHPTIEDHVTIYPGATILGGETVIGQNSTIGGNVFILNSIPARSLVTYEEGSVTVREKKRPASQTPVLSKA